LEAKITNVACGGGIMADRVAVAGKAAKGLLHKLNEAIARKMWVSIRYVWQHVWWDGVRGFAIHHGAKSIGTTEMEYVEAIVINQRREVLP
jgi:hypothetical protein